MAGSKNTGWAFPLQTDELTGKILLTEYEQDVRQSLFVLLSTRKGERLMNPDYGCDLQRFAFENVTYSLITQIEREVTEAIARHEPRARDVSVRLRNEGDTSDTSAQQLIMEINYKPIDSDEYDSIIYPMVLSD